MKTFQKCSANHILKPTLGNFFFWNISLRKKKKKTEIISRECMDTGKAMYGSHNTQSSLP